MLLLFLDPSERCPEILSGTKARRQDTDSRCRVSGSHLRAGTKDQVPEMRDQAAGGGLSLSEVVYGNGWSRVLGPGYPL